MAEEIFNGQVTIKIRFRTNPEYVKFRKYILKTVWMPGDAFPNWEEMVMNFHSIRDLNTITKFIVNLLQMGFEVYSTRYKLESQLAEEEHPPEGDEDDYPDELDDIY